MDLDRLTGEVNQFTIDTINHLRSLRLNLVATDTAIQAELDALEVAALTRPTSVIGTAAPSQGIGGGNLLGSSLLLSRSDHNHTIRETAGPTDLTVGSWLDGEISRRVGSVLVGRQFEVKILTTSPATTNVAAANVSTDMAFTLKANTSYMVVFPLFASSAATTTGVMLGLNFSGTTSALRYGFLSATNNTTMQSAETQTNDTLLGQTGVGPGGTSRLQLLVGVYQTTSAGTLSLRFATGIAASTVTIGARSMAFLVQT
jgi:hypothetical protein